MQVIEYARQTAVVVDEHVYNINIIIIIRVWKLCTLQNHANTNYYCFEQ